MTTAYWASFQAGFDSFAGYPLSKLGDLAFEGRQLALRPDRDLFARDLFGRGPGEFRGSGEAIEFFPGPSEIIFAQPQQALELAAAARR